MPRLIIAVVSVLLLFTFQNCGDVQFSRLDSGFVQTNLDTGDVEIPEQLLPEPEVPPGDDTPTDDDPGGDTPVGQNPCVYDDPTDNLHEGNQYPPVSQVNQMGKAMADEDCIPVTDDDGDDDYDDPGGDNPINFDPCVFVDPTDALHVDNSNQPVNQVTQMGKAMTDDCFPVVDDDDDYDNDDPGDDDPGDGGPGGQNPCVYVDQTGNLHQGNPNQPVNQVTQQGKAMSNEDCVPVSDDDSDDDYDDDETFEYVCVLREPRGPIRIDFVEDVLVPGTTSVKRVCMTQFACENIVTQVFNKAKAVHVPRHCENHPRVIHLNDEMVQKYTDALK